LDGNAVADFVGENDDAAAVAKKKPKFKDQDWMRSISELTCCCCCC
jgi:hypothetical protein